MLTKITVHELLTAVKISVVPGLLDIGSAVYAKQSTRCLFELGRFRFELTCTRLTGARARQCASCQRALAV